MEHLETSRTGHLGPLERILWGRSLPGGCAAASPPSPASERGVLRGVGGFTLAGSHGWLLLSTPIVAVEHRPNISPHYTDGGSGETALQNISLHYTDSGTSGTHTSSSGTSETALHHSRGEPRCSRSKIYSEAFLLHTIVNLKYFVIDICFGIITSVHIYFSSAIL